MPTLIHALSEVADVIRNGLSCEALAVMPQGRLPDSVLEAELEDERPFVGTNALAPIEARIGAPRTLFRIEWGYLTLSRSEGDRNVPPHVNLCVYLDEAIKDPTISYDLAAYLPRAIRDLINARDQRRLRLCIDSGGPLCCAELTFWMEGDASARERCSADVSAFLASFIGGGALELALDEVTAVM
ncbi:hypothetical protein [Paraburkholderia sp. J8-2]|uniref:hypothetical protein n=1 Tax=Paraburkholderia sp. J8-2 TaxID=2805440 RepID=UPI002AB7F073|nr:hypothetical protein [Paraburkholderia sp. J8-2]